MKMVIVQLISAVIGGLISMVIAMAVIKRELRKDDKK